ncbi:MAG TPA: hypothetical protein VEH30_16235 [Terriglobales bacterium]|nr:hypothetical protein [Terriglobales bacterium]
MQTRLAAFALAVYLSLTVLGCSKKTDQSADQNAANTPAATPAPAVKAEEPKKPRVETVTVPAGTSLTVRLGEAVGSKISQPGQSFSASLADAVQVDGKTVIPAGAAARGTVVDAKPLGRFKGGASLQLQLVSITINGTERQIQTAAVSQTEKGKGKRTAVLAGGGAGLGALIGGLAGGGKGAAIGAAAGAGAGGAGAAFTGNKDIVMPAESALTFSLSQPLEVKEREKE